MGTLNLTLPDGRSGSVTVGDDFATLSPDKQTATIEDIKAALAPHNSFSSDIQGGLHDLGTNASQGAKVVGGVMSRNGMPEWGGAVSDAGDYIANKLTPNEPPGPSPSQQLTGAIKNGDWSSVPGLVMHSAVRALPSAAPILAGGAVAGPLGAAAAAGAESLGPESYARAANNGRAEPTTGDVVGALPGTAGQAVGGALIPGIGKVASPLARAGLRTAEAAAGGAIMDTSGQLGASVGTDKGAQFDPAQTAGSALTMGALGGANAGRDIASSGIKSASDAIMSRTAVPDVVSPEDAQSKVRVGAMYDQFLQNAQRTRGDTAPNAVLNSVKTEVANRTLAYARSLNDIGLLDDDLYQTARRVLLDQALRHNNTITESDGVGPATLFDDIQHSGLNPDVLAPLTNGIRDLNTLAPTSFLKNQTGPFRAALGAVGDVAGNVATLGLGGHAVSRMAAPIGGALDSILGTATPKVLLQRLAAARYLRQNGLQPGPDTLGALQNAQSVVDRASALPSAMQTRAATGDASLAAESSIAAANQKAAALKDTQVGAMEQQRAQQNAATDRAFTSATPDTSAIDDYLSGKLTDPSLLTARPMTTAEEIALNNQRLANQATLAKTQAQQGKLFDASAASNVDDMAQAAIDKATRRNAVKLAMSDSVPSDRPDVPPEAAAAAVTQALRQAQGVMNDASEGGSDALDRATVGLPMRDPIPVNTPLAGTTEPPAAATTAQRLQQAADLIQAQQGPQSAPQAPAVSPAVTAAQAATQPPARTGRPVWSRYMANGDPGITHEMALDAVSKAEQAGKVPPGTFELLSGHQGGAPGNILQAAQAYLPDTSTGAAREPVHDPIRWNSAATAYTKRTLQHATLALKHGDIGLYNAVTDVASQTRPAEKAAVRDAYLSTIQDPAAREQAAQWFPSWLTDHGRKD